MHEQLTKTPAERGFFVYMKQKVAIEDIDKANECVSKVAVKTPLQYSERLSKLFGAEVYLKREDLQVVRSFKLRGAYNKMCRLNPEEKKRGVVCASAGNHAQGVAYSCAKLKIKGTIFMPSITPLQKIDRVRQFGGSYITIKLVGHTYDDASKAAHTFCEQKKAVYVHPFNDPLTIAGQGTVGKEIFEQLGGIVDVVVVPIGGGGLVSGIGTYMKGKLPKVKIVGVEPKGAASMHTSLNKKQVVMLENIDTFVDGAAVQQVGDLNYEIATDVIDGILLSEEGKVCSTMIDLYQQEGIIAEPAGALAISALDELQNIQGKTVVCVLSGGNNDLLRYPEILEKSLVYKGLKHYYLIEFAQKPGQLREFLNSALGPNDDIVLFEYTKKTNREKGPALVGIELTKRENLEKLEAKMDKIGLKFRKITSDDLVYNFLV